MKKRDIDIFGILLGVVIGCILGFFLSTRIDLDSKTPGEDLETASDVGNIYLVQLGKFDDPAIALDLYKELAVDSYNSIVVNVGLNYYVYAAIGKTESSLELTVTELETAGYDCIVKKEYILDKANAVIEKEKDYKFYNDAIDALMKNLEGKSFTIDEVHFDRPVNLELLTLIISLQNIKNEKLLSDIRLSVYEIILENLSI